MQGNSSAALPEYVKKAFPALPSYAKGREAVKAFAVCPIEMALPPGREKQPRESENEISVLPHRIGALDSC